MAQIIRHLGHLNSLEIIEDVDLKTKHKIMETASLVTCLYKDTFFLL